MPGFFRRIGDFFKRKPKPQIPAQTPAPKPTQAMSSVGPRVQYNPRLEKVKVNALYGPLSKRGTPLREDQIEKILAEEPGEKPTQTPDTKTVHLGLADEVDRIHQARGFPDYTSGWKASTHLKETFKIHGKALGFDTIDQMFTHYEEVLFDSTDPRHKSAVNFVRESFALAAKQSKRLSPQTKGRIMGRLVAGLAEQDIKRKQRGA